MENSLNFLEKLVGPPFSLIIHKIYGVVFEKLFTTKILNLAVLYTVMNCST